MTFFFFQYCCYLEECKEKFKNTEERLDHCVKVHRLPKDFRFEQKPRKGKTKEKKANKRMEVDPTNDKDEFTLNNSKKKTFPKYKKR
jgi:hypothetical protein